MGDDKMIWDPVLAEKYSNINRTMDSYRKYLNIPVMIREEDVQRMTQVERDFMSYLIYEQKSIIEKQLKFYESQLGDNVRILR